LLGVRVVDEETDKLIETMLTAAYDDPLIISNAKRREILELLIKFYSDHLENLGEMRSLHVLREVLS